MAGDVLLTARDLEKSFSPGQPALRGVSLTIRQGETVGLVGESGSGKSTTARLVLGLLAPDRGTVRFGGLDPYRVPRGERRSLRARLQYIPQSSRRSLNPRLRAGESVAFTLRAHGVRGARLRAATGELLERVGLDPALARRYPHELSGGQVQRFAIARALATGPELVVCDEPTSALDKSVQAQVLNLLADLQRRTGVGYLFVSHDLAVVEHLSDRVLVLRHGEVVEEGPAETLWRHPTHPYTRALLAATGAGPLSNASAEERQ